MSINTRPSCNCPHGHPTICTAVQKNTPATVVEAMDAACQCQCHFADAVLLPGVLISYETWVQNKAKSHKNKVR